MIPLDSRYKDAMEAAARLSLALTVKPKRNAMAGVHADDPLISVLSFNENKIKNTIFLL